jgi:hypothetical protein
MYFYEVPWHKEYNFQRVANKTFFLKSQFVKEEADFWVRFKIANCDLETWQEYQISTICIHIQGKVTPAVINRYGRSVREEYFGNRVHTMREEHILVFRKV